MRHILLMFTIALFSVSCQRDVIDEEYFKKNIAYEMFDVMNLDFYYEKNMISYMGRDTTALNLLRKRIKNIYPALEGQGLPKKEMSMLKEYFEEKIIMDSYRFTDFYFEHSDSTLITNSMGKISLSVQSIYLKDDLGVFFARNNCYINNDKFEISFCGKNLGAIFFLKRIDGEWKLNRFVEIYSIDNPPHIARAKN